MAKRIEAWLRFDTRFGLMDSVPSHGQDRSNGFFGVVKPRDLLSCQFCSPFVRVGICRSHWPLGHAYDAASNFFNSRRTSDL